MFDGYGGEDDWRRLAGETRGALSSYREGLVSDRRSRFGCWAS